VEVRDDYSIRGGKCPMQCLGVSGLRVGQKALGMVARCANYLSEGGRGSCRSCRAVWSGGTGAGDAALHDQVRHVYKVGVAAERTLDVRAWEQDIGAWYPPAQSVMLKAG